MKREDDQRLWDLLGQVRPAEVSPFFARNIVRTVRERPQSFQRLRIWLGRRILIPATGLALAVIAAIVMIHRPAALKPVNDTPDVIAAIDPQDYDVIADLDDLMAADENNLWDDDTQTL
jgi:hypothetical protein